MSKNLQIRNSTAEFLVFTKQAGESTIDVRIEDETVWLTQKLLAVLFEVEVNTINYHIKEIYKIQEQKEAATIRNFRIVQTEGKRFATTESCKINYLNPISIKKELGGKNDELA
jgi:hypothetical protein